ncbi:MAG: hypothetical protein WCD87_03855, partial [Pseudolabrys sp.]
PPPSESLTIFSLGFALRMALSLSRMALRFHHVLVSRRERKTRYQQKYRQIVRLTTIMAEQP